MRLHELIDELNSGKKLTNGWLLNDGLVLEVCNDKEVGPFLLYSSVDGEDDPVDAFFTIDCLLKDDWKVYEETP